LGSAAAVSFNRDVDKQSLDDRQIVALSHKGGPNVW
jgi:hypothetical protein